MKVDRATLRSTGLDVIGLCLALVAAACAPRWDWRELRPAGFDLALVMPCRPAGQARQLTLAMQPVLLTLHVCSERGVTFAIAAADVGDPTRVGTALAALGAAAVANLHGRIESESDSRVPGMTPNPQARRWGITGRLPDGQAVAEQVEVFSHGARVYQATLVGRQIDADVAATYFDALRVLP